jgi:hypothetical protein
MARSKLVLVCTHCGNEFEREEQREKYRIKHKRKGPFCSKSCAVKGSSRYQKGSAHANAILTEDDVRMIRTRFKNGVPIPTLIKLSGMAENTIRSIVYRKSWTHVSDN